MALACDDLLELDLASGPLGPSTLARVRIRKKQSNGTTAQKTPVALRMPPKTLSALRASATVGDEAEEQDFDLDDDDEGGDGRHARKDLPDGAMAIIVGATFEAAVPKTLRQRLRNGRALAMSVCPTAAWVAPIAAYVRSEYGDQWCLHARDGTDRRANASVGSGEVARDVSRGMCVMGIAADAVAFFRRLCRPRPSSPSASPRRMVPCWPRRSRASPAACPACSTALSEQVWIYIRSSPRLWPRRHCVRGVAAGDGRARPKSTHGAMTVDAFAVTSFNGGRRLTRPIIRAFDDRSARTVLLFSRQLRQRTLSSPRCK